MTAHAEPTTLAGPAERSTSPAQDLDAVDVASGVPSPPSIRLFVSFDLDHDEQLYELLLEQSRIVASGFQVLGRSEHPTDTELWGGRLRKQICEADQLVVICGEHTDAAPNVSVELRIATEEGTPYFLLWGQRHLMCKMPIGATGSESMYSWTPRILQERLAYTRRTDAMAETEARDRPGTTAS